jgi:anti-sigma B factor antagonist
MEGAGMDLEEREEGGVTVLTVHAPEIDASHVEALKHDMAAVLARRPRVVLDLGPVRFVDSAGLGAILTLRLKLQEGGELAISGAREPIATLLRLARVEKVIPTYATAAEAVAAMG